MCYTTLLEQLVNIDFYKKFFVGSSKTWNSDSEVNKFLWTNQSVRKFIWFFIDCNYMNAKMFQSKLSTMRLGASNIISSSNRLQLAIQASISESMVTAATTTYCPRRYQHVMIAPAKPKSYNHFSINAKNARQFSIETIKHACVSIIITKLQIWSRWIEITMIYVMLFECWKKTYDKTGMFRCKFAF